MSQISLEELYRGEGDGEKYGILGIDLFEFGFRKIVFSDIKVCAEQGMAKDVRLSTKPI